MTISTGNDAVTGSGWSGSVRDAAEVGVEGEQFARGMACDGSRDFVRSSSPGGRLGRTRA